MALPLFLAGLLQQGLQLIGNAVLAKGKDWVKDKTGVDLDKPELTSEDYMKLQQYQMEHEEELIKLRQVDDRLGFEIEQAYLADVQNARGMQMTALSQQDVFSKRFLYWYAIFWSSIAAFYILMITFFEIPTDNIRFADTILGFILGTVIAQIINFFFGSSKGSADKAEVIKGVVENASGK